MTLLPSGGAALPVSVTTTRKVQGGSAIPVYGYMTAPTDGRPAMGGSAIPVRVLTAADLKQNGGQWTLEGRPHAMPVYTAPATTTVMGGPAIAVYPVNAWPTVAVVPAWVPTDLAGLAVWLKADAGLYKDAAKAQSCTADGDAVYTWEDQSGNGNDAVQAMVGKRPVRKDGVKALPVVRFDGSDDFLRTTLAINQPYTLAAVINPKAWADGTQLIGGVTANVAVYQNGLSPQIKTYAGSSSAAIDLPVNAFAVLYVIFNGASSAIYVNAASLTGQNPGVWNPGGFTLADSSATGVAAQMDLAEFLVYDSALSDANRTSITNYFNGRWAV